jgi:hypothetical protein
MKITNEQLGCAIHSLLREALNKPIDEYGKSACELLVYLVVDNPKGYVDFEDDRLFLHQYQPEVEA